ncbi:O-antigen ligase family protein [Thiohalobacter sp. IOR34]|uniref:O-antigen ligase family protein n=1 Tax=Thiohalobacter sp. IOR34 TaxID=3057176 RepID=UPI0025AF5ACC|nr:O-antigen ligase family protein [Thiohalobacter sp. IOR34]WJW75271.1 O-antigen ligase family protein [Thiohalobacter sp. IOR34]
MNPSQLLRDNWRWLLILACLPLFATKTLFNLPMAIMMFIGIARFARAPGEVLRDPLLRLMTLLFLCFWLPILFSLPDAVNLKRAASTALVDLRFFFAGLFVIDTLRDATARRRLFLGAGLIGLGWTLDALLQMVLGYDLLGYPYNGERPTGIFHPKLRIGTVTATLSPLLFEFIRRGASRRPWLWLLLPAVLGLILVSGNRNAWLMLAVAGVFYVVYVARQIEWRQLLKLGLAGGLSLAVVLVLAMQYGPMQARMAQTLGVLSDDPQALDDATGRRLSLWQTAINTYRAHWINGVGPRGFRYVYLQYAEPDDYWVSRMKPGEQAYPQSHPHQMALEVAAETGTFGLLGYLLMAGLVLRELFRVGAEAQAEFWPWAIAVLVAWFPGNAHMALYASYWGTIAWWLLLVALGMLAADGRYRRA